ncbi:MAG: hypothetical protein ACREO3_01325 [Arenimonas sp.]
MKRPASGAARWLPVLPDAMTCAFFLVVWANPLVFGPLSVRTAMLTMLLEFFLVHATGIFTVFVYDTGSRWKRIGGLLGLSSLYLLMVGAYARSFGEWWPLVAFGWLAAGKIAWVWTNTSGVARPAASGGAGPMLNFADDDAISRHMAAWAASVALFLAGVAYTTIAQIPRWGMTVALQPGFGLNMASEGLWESQPHRVVALGAIYFGVTFVVKVLFALRDRWRAGRAQVDTAEAG